MNPIANPSPSPETAVTTCVNKPGDMFMNISAFSDAQRMVKPLCQSSLVPAQYRSNIADCMIALEMAQRLNASPLMVMQNLYIVHGKPAWSSTFLVACINQSGRFSPLRYRMTGTRGKDDYGCVCWAVDKGDGKTVLESPEITIGIAKKEGWYSKPGSKWQTMPELMLRYRTATLFARLFAPELTMGIRTQDEVIDIEAKDITTAIPEKQPQTAIPADLSVNAGDSSGSTETPLKNAAESETAIGHYGEPPTESEMQLESEEQK